MKFNDGHWQIPENLELLQPVDVHSVRVDGDELVVIVSSRPLKTRGDQLNLMVFTIRLFAAAEGVIGVRIEHYQGVNPQLPEFTLYRERNIARIEETDDAMLIHAGSVAARVPKSGPYTLDFLRDGKRISGARAKTGGYAKDTDDNARYLFERLDLAVGENVYGLGERFASFVKNGQSIDIWNRDDGTGTEQAYKNIPFFMTSNGWGLLVNHPVKVEFEIASDKVS